jgi:hypothetical protein
MSVNFPRPVGQNVKDMLREALGQPVAADDQTFLHDRLKPLDQRVMSQIAREANQPVSVEMNEIGDVKVIRGVQWLLEKDGWVRLVPDLPATQGVQHGD